MHCYTTVPVQDEAGDDHNKCTILQSTSAMHLNDEKKDTPCANCSGWRLPLLYIRNYVPVQVAVGHLDTILHYRHTSKNEMQHRINTDRIWTRSGLNVMPLHKHWLHPASVYIMYTTHLHAHCYSIYMQSHIYTYIHMHHYISYVINTYTSFKHILCILVLLSGMSDGRARAGVAVFLSE